MKTKNILQILAIALILISSFSSYAQNVFTVTKTTDPDPFIYSTNPNDPTIVGTLQWAVRKTNDETNPCIINFNIPGSDQQEIILNYELPLIKNNSVVIDATTQSGYSYGSPTIKVNGQANLGTCFQSFKCENVIKGFHITGFKYHGIVINNGSNSEIWNNIITAIDNGANTTAAMAIRFISGNGITAYGNIIGTDNINNSGLGIEDYGIYLQYSNNCIIGGTGNDQGNTITNCGLRGVRLSTNSNYNKISGNTIFDIPFAISFSTGSNQNIQPPIISNYAGNTASGTSSPNNTIEIFGSTGDENANEYFISTIADISGNWSATVPEHAWGHIVATATDGSNNTSKLSLAVEKMVFDDQPTWVGLNGNISPEKPVCNIIESGSNYLILNVEVKGFYKQNVLEDGTVYQKVYFPGNASTVEIGMPELPTISELIQIPNNSNVNATVFNSSVEILSDYIIVPFQTPLLEDEDPKSFEIDEAFYSSNSYFPYEDYEIGNQMIFRNIYNVNLTLNPMKFNPHESTLQVISNFQIRLDFDKNIVPVTENYSPTFEKLHDNIILNYLPPTSKNTKTTDYSLLIIVADQYGNSLDDFIEWKNKKGFETKLVTLSETGNTASSIKSYIENEYTSNNIEYVLFVGDYSEIPHITSDWEHDCHDFYNWYPWGDYGYGCMDGMNDFQPEVLIGRFSVLNNDELNNIVNKTISYEKNPPVADWINKCLLVAHREGAPGKYQGCKEEIRTATYMSNKTFDIAYGSHASSGGNDATNQDVINAIINGRGIVNYRGHGTPTGWMANWGYENNEFNEDEIGLLNNGNMTPVVFSIACSNTYPLNMSGTTYIENNLGELFLKSDDGAVAFYGATCASFTTPNHIIDKNIFYNILNDIEYHASNVTTLSILGMLSSYNYSCFAQKNARIYLWLGDPTLEIWTDVPNTFAVNINPNEISLPLSNNVNVQIGNLNTGQEALVCLYKEGEVLGYKTVIGDASNNAVATFFNITPMTAGVIDVIVTSHNYLPFEGTIDVLNSCVYTSNTMYINQNETWSSLAYLNDDISIEDGATLTITSQVDIADGVEIIVRRGGKLIIDGATLTACNEHWKGILVEGDWGIIPGPTSEDPGPGILYIKNNSKIEYAERAVYSDYNGVVKVTDSEFLNCPKGIELESYYESYLEWSVYPKHLSRAYIKRSSFITDTDYKEYPEHHVKLFNVENVGIFGNEFSNTNPEKIAVFGGTGYPVSKRGKGIYAVNSELIVKSTCSHYYMHPCPGNEVPNKFKKLYYGIHGLSMYSGIGSAKITRNEFVDNYRGILLENIPGAAVDGNDFEVGLLGVNPNIYPINPVISSYPNATYGLYLSGCTGYSVQENNFHDGLYGIIVNSSGEDNNIVYHNTFENLSFNMRGASSVALNTNGNYNAADLSGDDGLDVKCNKYKQSDHAIAVVNGSISRLQGIPGGNTNELAGNTFERLASPYVESDFYVRISNGFADNPIYQYYQHNNPLTILEYYNGDDDNPADDEVDAHIQIYGYIEEDACPVLISNGFVLHELVPIVKDISLILKNKQVEIDDLVDGGKTEYFVDMVENMTNGNFKNVCKELLEASPYLSNEVLDAFMSTDEMFNPVRKSNVIITNSPLPEALKSKIDGMVMPGPFKQLVWEYQAGDNPRELKEQELSIIREEKQLKTNELVREFYADTTSENSDLVIETLQEVDDNHARMALVNVLSSLERYDEASYELQTIEASIVDLPEYKREELYQYVDLQNIALECIVSDNKEGLITSNQPFLYEIAESKSYKGNIQAQLMLEYAGLADYPEEIIILGESTKSMLANTEDEKNSSTDYDFDAEDLITIYPNPAKDIITIEYALFESDNNSMLSIYSTDGKLVLTKPINSIIGVEEVNVSNISNGNYFVVVGNKGLNGYVKQIVIKH